MPEPGPPASPGPALHDGGRAGTRGRGWAPVRLSQAPAASAAEEFPQSAAPAGRVRDRLAEGGRRGAPRHSALPAGEALGVPAPPGGSCKVGTGPPPCVTLRQVCPDSLRAQRLVSAPGEGARPNRLPQAFGFYTVAP